MRPRSRPARASREADAPQRTRGRRLVQASITTAVTVGSFLAAYVVVGGPEMSGWLGADVSQTARGAEPAAAGAANAQSRAAEQVQSLVDGHGCWTGSSGHAATLPGHAVLTWPGANKPAYVGAKGVGVALDHLFGDKHRPGLQVHAFCP
jgi:hypothetical protein